MLDIESVPEEVRRSHPKLYNYSPPASTISDAVVSNVNAAVDHPQDEIPSSKSDAKESANNVENVLVSSDEAPSVPTVNAPDSSKKPSPLEVFNRTQADESVSENKVSQQDISSTFDEVKKKKRIQPTVVANLPQLVVAGSSSISSNAVKVDLTHHSGISPIISLVDESNDFVNIAPNSVEILPPLEPTLRDPIMDSPPLTPMVTNLVSASNNIGNVEQNQSVEPPSKKKRIAPTLVSTLK
jgi:hypothetical protein